MKKYLLIFWITFYIVGSNALSQTNLIPNPSFEDSLAVPQAVDEFNKCSNWYAAFATPDYYSTYSPIYPYSSCSAHAPSNAVGYQYPHTGNFYSGIAVRGLLPVQGYPIYSNYFELIGVQLISPLIKDHLYDFTLYYSLAEISGYLNNQLSAYFSINPFLISSSGVNPLDVSWYNTHINWVQPQVNHDTTQYISQDTVNWHILQGCFVASGGEQFVTIGNFRDGRYNKIKPINTNFNSPCLAAGTGTAQQTGCYLFIDDVSLYDVGWYAGKAQCIKDTLLCIAGSTLNIGNNIKDSATYTWYPPTALSCTNCPNPVASPTVSTMYYVVKTLCTVTSKDSVLVQIFTPNQPLSAGYDYPVSICAGDSLAIGSSPIPLYSYNWQPSLSVMCATCALTTAIPNTTTTYTLTRSACSETTTATVTIGVVPMPTLNITPTATVIQIGDGVQITAQGAVYYSWYPITNINNFYLANPIFSPTTTTEYCVIGENGGGIKGICSDTICVIIQVDLLNDNVIIPNIFTPNGDNTNDTWGIEFKHPEIVKDFKLSVFNRWGVKLYEADKPNAKWDGRSLSGEVVPTGTYYYVAEFIINPAQGGKKQEAKGYFTLMR